MGHRLGRINASKANRGVHAGYEYLMCREVEGENMREVAAPSSSCTLKKTYQALHVPPAVSSCRCDGLGLIDPCFESDAAVQV